MEHTVDFSYQGHYYTLGDKEKAKQIWFVLHGYGQLASYFLRKFGTLESHNIYVVAPEALSKFYLEDVGSRMRSGNTRVGGSWMTRENRLTDIKNYLTFLNSVYDKEATDKEIPVTLLGFSQGAATATRWALDGHIHCSRLILWAGILPADIDVTTGRDVLQSKKIIMVSGNQDPFLNDDRFREFGLLSSKLGLNTQHIEFEGGHSIDEKTLLKLI